MVPPLFRGRTRSARDRERRPHYSRRTAARQSRETASTRATTALLVFLVVEDPDDARALSARVLLHLHQHGKALRQCGASGVHGVEGEDVSIAPADIGPQPPVVFHFDLVPRHATLLQS